MGDGNLLEKCNGARSEKVVAHTHTTAAEDVSLSRQKKTPLLPSLCLSLFVLYMVHEFPEETVSSP